MIHHLLSYFGQRQPWRRHQARLKLRARIRAWLRGPDHAYQPRSGLAGDQCRVCGCHGGMHLGLLGRLAYRWGLHPGAMPGGGR